MDPTLPDPLITLLITGALGAVTAALLWPGWGLVARLRRARRLSDRVAVEDALKHVRKCELHNQSATLASVSGSLGSGRDEAARLLVRMEALGLLETTADGFRLTPQGRSSALHIIRAHRLWEMYLADRTGYPEVDWHAIAESREHDLGPEEADRLSAELGHPTHDPHGDPIPDPWGTFVSHGGVPLASIAVGSAARIVHLEDEPNTVYAQLLAAGLDLGMIVNVVDADPARIRIWAGGDEIALAPVVAANVSVIPLPVTESPTPAPDDSSPLSGLRPGESATVVGISPRCRGPQRRRLLDLGVLPGASISAELASATGGSTAYRIRDALIALRTDQASLIHVRRPAGVTR